MHSSLPRLVESKVPCRFFGVQCWAFLWLVFIFGGGRSEAANNPRQNLEPDGNGRRTFNMYVHNDTDSAVSFTVSRASCTDSPLNSDTYGPVARGERVTVWIARVQGNGCDGEQGTFWLIPDGFGGADRQEFTFDNRGAIFMANTPNGYSSILRKNPFDGSYTWTISTFQNTPRLAMPLDERLTLPRNTLAADTGQWGSGTEVSLLSFDHRPGFWENFYDDCAGIELWHVQHVARLPNRGGRAYFVVVQSRSHNGYVTVVRTYPGMLDPVTDQIVPPANGASVGEFIWQDVYTGTFNENFNPVGNWNHPGKTDLIGGVLMVTGQNWEASIFCFSGLGDSEDRVLFYDVRDPDNPTYWGSMTQTQLGIDEIDTMGVARSASTGEYLLTVGGGNTFRSKTMTPDFNQWTKTTAYNETFSGQHGINFNSYQTVTPSPTSGLPNGVERLIYVDAVEKGFGFREFVETTSNGQFSSFQSHSLANFEPSLPGADRDWDANGLYVSRKGIPIVYTGKSASTANINLYQVTNDQNLALELPHPDQVVTNLNDHGPGSLREAIGFGGKITFAPNLNGNTLALTNGPLFVTLYDVEIDATAVRGGLVIVGDSSRDDANGVFRIEEGTKVILDSVTIRSGFIQRITPCVIVNGGELIVRNSTFDHDNVDGLRVNSGRAELENCTFLANLLHGVTTGSIVNARGATTVLRHCTLTTRRQEDFAVLISTAPTGILTLENSIVAHQGDAEQFGIRSPAAVLGNFRTIGANLISSYTGSVLSGPSPIIGDAGLLPPARVGSLTDTLPLQSLSPAVNAAAPSNTTRDQNGFPRRVNVPGNDLGAFELQATRVQPISNPNNVPLEGFRLEWSVVPGAQYEVQLDDGTGFTSLGQLSETSFVLPGVLVADRTYTVRVDTLIGGRVWPGTPTNFSTRGPLVVTILSDENDAGIGFGEGDSLREVISAAQPGELIRFAPHLSGGTLALEGSALSIDQSMTIDGSRLADQITIRAALGSRIFSVSPSREIVIRGLRLSGGFAERGGAVLNDGGIVTLRDCSLLNNISRGNGGAVYNGNGGQLFVVGSRFTGNRADGGGGIFNESGCRLDISLSSFTSNSALDEGGGVSNQGIPFLIEKSDFSRNGAGRGGAIASADVGGLIENCTLSANGSDLGFGGGLFNQGSGDLILRHCTIADNIGGGIFNEASASLALENSIVSSNLDRLNGNLDLAGDFSAIGANLVRFHSGTLLSGPEPLRVDPMIGSLRLNGTMPPLIGSPVLDAGVLSAETPELDQENQCCRPFGDGPDLGAVEAKLSADASLAWISTSAGILTPDFRSTIYEYTAKVPESETGVAVRAERGSGGQSIEVRINDGDYAPLSSNTGSEFLPLSAGSNKVELKVTARNGVAFRVYSLSIEREPPLVVRGGLISLGIDAGALSPVFDPRTNLYDVFVPQATESVSLTAAVADESATLEVRKGFADFVSLESGTASVPIELEEGANRIDLRVIGEGGVTTAIYSVEVVRGAVETSDANLASLQARSGVLSPPFSQGRAHYEFVADAQGGDLAIIPTAAESTASIRVRINDGDFQTGSSGSAISLSSLPVGRNRVDVEVTAPDATTSKTYSIMIPVEDRGILWVSEPKVDFSGATSFFSATNPAVSADGRFVVFESNAANLVANDDNDEKDIFVLNRTDGSIRRVSVSDTGEEGDSESRNPSISGDGRYIAFESEASNLVPDDNNGRTSKSQGRDVFVYDQSMESIERISLREGGRETNLQSGSPSISGDGRYVAFTSADSNIISDFQVSNTAIYVWDRVDEVMTGIAVPFADLQANRSALDPVISNDGNFVAFELNVSRSGGNSEAYKFQDIYLFNRETVSVERITGTKFGQDADGTEAAHPAISGDGRYVVFESDRDDVDFFDTNRGSDVFIYDRVNATTRRVSSLADNVDAPFTDSNSPSISGDGRFVAFHSSADNFVGFDANETRDVFVKDLMTGEIRLLSVTPEGLAGNGASTEAAISFDGRVVAFTSRASNLVIESGESSSGVFAAFANPLAASSLAELASIVTSIGVFDPLVREHTAFVPDETDSVRLRLSPVDSESAISVQLNTGGFESINAGQISSALALETGDNVIDIRVVAADQNSEMVYQLNINRALNDNADLVELGLFSGELLSYEPAFSSDVLGYQVIVPNEIGSVSVVASPARPAASVSVNGVAVGPESPGVVLDLMVGSHPIDVTVTAEDGTTIKTYRVELTRRPSSNADLQSLTLSVEPDSGILPFDPAVTEYRLGYNSNQESVAVTPLLADLGASVSVNGVRIESGASSDLISLSPGDNMVELVVTAADGVTTKTYLLTVIREIVVEVVESNANLAFLSLSAGALSPIFAQDTTGYNLSVVNEITTTTVFPVVADPAASAQVGGIMLQTGIASAPIELNEGDNLITILVTGSTGTTKQYQVTVFREPAPVESNANLAFLSLTAGVFTPAFNQETTSYTLDVDGDVASTAVFAVVADPNARVAVNGVEQASGANSASIDLARGENEISIEVTGETGNKKVYTVSVTREGSASDLTLTIGISGDQAVLTWAETGLVLQQSSDLLVWTDVVDAVSPFQPEVGSSSRFYRLRP